MLAAANAATEAAGAVMLPVAKTAVAPTLMLAK
jgi:hypothetical protein